MKPAIPAPFPMRTRQSGMSLVEVMVGAVLALVASIVIFQTYAVFEGYKRTSTSGGDATTAGAVGLFMIGRDVRQAGYGMNGPPLLGCNVAAYDGGVSPPRTFSFTAAPVVIAQGAASTDSDSLTASYSSSTVINTPATLTHDMPSASSDFQVDNVYGFQPGDLVIATDGVSCTLAQVTQIPGASLNVIHNSGNYTTPTGQVVPARYNKPAGLGNPFPKGGALYDIGGAPTVDSYSVQNGQLWLQNSTTGGAAVAIADGIVNMQADYGMDDGANGGTAGDGVIDEYTTVTPGTQAAWLQLVSVRVAVVARSAQREKPNASGVCTTTSAAPTWSGGSFDLSADPNWKCYRYKVFETSIPVRNMIWKPS